MKLEEAAEKPYHCGKCALCHAVCLVYQTLKHEGFSPRGRVQLSRALLEGELEPSPALFERLQACLDCKRCLEACPSGVEVDEIVLSARAEVARYLPFSIGMAVRMLSSPAWMASVALPLASKVFKALDLSNPQSLLRRLAFFAPPRYLPSPAPRPFTSEAPELSRPSRRPKGRVVIFAGCSFTRLLPQVAWAGHNVALRAGYEVVVPRDFRCCGAPAEHMGLTNLVDKLTEHNRKVIARYKPDAVITFCASCGLTLKRHLGGESFEVLDLCELLFRDGWEEPQGEIRVRVTYHDPCHLARGQGLREEPRGVLRSIPEAEFVEMEEPDRCCGGAGLFFALFPELSIQIGLFKAEAARKVEAEIVATWCPACMMQLDDIMRRTGLRLPVRHVLEIVAASYAVADGLKSPEEARRGLLSKVH